MRKFFLFISFFVLIYFTYGFYLATYNINIFEKNTQSEEHELFHDYRGVSHVVTSYSKGSATPTGILLEAASAEIDFLFFTDLNLINRPYNISGYHGNVFTFSNQKVSYLDSHILIYSQNPDFYFDSMTSANAQLNQHFEESSENRNFLAVLAHPFKRGHSWTGNFPPGLDGIEVVNMRHTWQDVWFRERLYFIWSIITYPFNPEVALLRLIRDPKQELQLWDHLNRSSRTLGFLGNQTTAKIFNVLGQNFTFPSYEKSFKFASNHILLASELTGHIDSDRKKIFQAIEKGHFYFAFDSIGSPKGFAAYVKEDGKNRLMGENIKFKAGLDISVDLPAGLDVPFRIEVFKNGVLYSQSEKVNSKFPIDGKGVYRVVIKILPRLPLPDDRTWFGWIYTNPFFIQ